MPVLTPQQAAAVLERMRADPPPTCDLCNVQFSDVEPPHQTNLGPFPSWMCAACLTRHEAMLEGRKTGERR